MTFARFFGIGVVFAVLSAALTIAFSKYINIVEPWNNYVLWFLVIIITIACVRRLGVISFLEAILVAGVWLFFRMLLDAVVTAPILGVGIYGKAQLWVSYALIIATIFFLHKKRHIQVRKDLKAKHHGDH